jgi:uncharacterized protein YuzE
VSHYDREADIAAFDLEGFDGQRAYGEDHDWGLILRDADSNEVIGLEFWRASERFPAALLDALPQPKGEGTAVERQSA